MPKFYVCIWLFPKLLSYVKVENTTIEVLVTLVGTIMFVSNNQGYKIDYPNNNHFEYRYIRTDSIKFTEDIQENSSKNCDLPESMHGDIVKRAVDLYHVAVNGSLHAAQDAEQVQQRENVRNNYRNENNQ